MYSTSNILSWKAEGRAEGLAEGMALGMLEARREDLLKVLRVKYQTLPPELNALVRGSKEIDLLSRWFEAALAAPTIESFALLIRNR